MTNFNSRILTVSTLLVWSLGVVGCRDQIQLGAVLPLTGASSSYGDAVRKGLELALEEIQEQANTPQIAVEIVDSGSDPETAKGLLADLYGRGALAVIGGVTAHEAAAMVPVADEAGRVLLSPSTTVEALVGNSRQFYRLAPSDVVAGNTMANFAFRRLGVKTAVTYAEDELAVGSAHEGFGPSFEALGGELAASLNGTSTVQEAMVEAAKHAPDAVYVAGREATIGAAISELRSRRFKGRILTTRQFASSAAISSLGEQATGVLLTRAILDTESGEAVAGFFDRYGSKYGGEPGIFAAEGYDALKVLALAVAGRPALPSEVRKGLRDAVKNYAGVTGTLEFKSNGGVTKYPRVYSIAHDRSLVDHGKLLEQKSDKRRQAMEARRRELEELRKKMAKMASE